jgi:hypothetical protein
MKSTVIAGLIAAAGLACTAHAQVRISEVFGAGGNTPGTFGCPPYSHDYVELFNAGSSPVSIAGWRIQYSSATGSFQTVNLVTLPVGATIQPGKYYLVQMNTVTPATTGGCVYLPVPADFTGAGNGNTATSANLSGTAGKVALLDNTGSLLITSGCPSPFAANVVDYLGYGDGTNGVSTVANCAEGPGAGGAPSVPAGNQFAVDRINNGCVDTNNNQADFIRIAPNPRNSSSPANLCGAADCNNNGIADNIEILGNPALDCNNNTVLDSCEIAGNPGADCDVNGVIDSCQIAANPSLDCNTNNQLDFCDINNAGGSGGIGGRFDACNSNGLLDSCETPGVGEDCNVNNILDCWELKTGALTDVDANGTPDACEGAIVVEADINATVQEPFPLNVPPLTGGVRPANNGVNFYNIEGTNLGTFVSYGALNFQNSALTTPNVGRVYLFLQQANAGFTAGGLPIDPDNIELFFSNLDTIDFSEPTSPATNTNVIFSTFASQWSDRLSLLTYKFVQGTQPGLFGGTTGSGQTESYKLYDSSTVNTPGGDAIAAEIVAGAGDLVLLNYPIPGQDYVAATYAGRGNNQFRGPSLVVFPGGPICDSTDFNGDGIFPDNQDIIDFLDVFSGGVCPTGTCNDTDFNNDGIFPDNNDIVVFLVVFSGGPCS